MKQLYFCRHGLSELNVLGRWAGTSETPLTDEGRVQAQLAGQAARGYSITRIVCSPLSRAYETAEIIAAELGIDPRGITTCELVTERHFGSMEGQPWHEGFDMSAIADAETHQAVIERARRAYVYLQSIPDDVVLVVSHGGFGRALRHVVDPTTPFHGSPRFANAAIERLL